MEPAGDEPDAVEQLRRLQRVTDTALSRLRVEDLLDELLVRARALLRVDTAAVMLLDASGTELHATAASGLEREVYQGHRVPVGFGFAGRVAAGGRPLALSRVDATSVHSPALRAERIVALLGVPMITGGRVIGVLYVGSRTARAFTAADTELLQHVADRIAPATQARIHSLDQAAAHALQRSLLPSRPPSVAGLDLAVRYVPGAEVGVGGDWYDVFELPSGCIGLAVGDVAGNGLRAAVVMGRIRSALRAYALETDDPADVLARLDRKIQRFEPGAMATVLYGVIPPGLGALTLANAGHLPPVRVPATGPGAVAVVPPDLPLGAYPDAPRTTTGLALAPGEGLVFYTDGLIERRDRPLSVGLGLLAAAVSGAPAESMCSTVMAAMLQDGAPRDDIAVLALRRAGPQSTAGRLSMKELTENTARPGPGGP